MTAKRSALCVATLVLLGFLAGLAGCGKSEPTGGKRTFTIGMVTFAGYAPLYLAKEKGFFGNLDVQLKRIEEVPSIRAAMVKKDLDAYLATPDIALDTNAAPPGRAVWAIDESAGGDGVIVAPGMGANIGSLKGKKVAAEPGLPPNFLLLYFLHKNGMSLKDVQYQDMSTQNAATAFVSKAVDAAGIYEPYLSTAKGQRAGSQIALSSKDVPGMIVDLILVREDVAQQRGDDVLQLIGGWRRAMSYIHGSPDDAYSIMAKSFNLPVKEFKDTVAGIHWLDLDDNHRLFGTPSQPGPLFSSFDVVKDVLRRNRGEVYPAESKDYLLRQFIEQVK